MSTHFPLFALLLLSGTTAIHAQPATNLAVELTKIAKFDEATLLGAQLALQRSTMEGVAPKAESDCFSQKSYVPLTAPIAGYLSSAMTEGELEAALRFYKSEVGKKFTQHGIVSFYKNYRFETKEQLPSFSKTETTEILDFSHTPAGNKLMRQQILRIGVQSGDIAKTMDELRSACRLR